MNAMSTNPFEDEPATHRPSRGAPKMSRREAPAASMSVSASASASVTLSNSASGVEQEPAIWAARNVDWPIPSALTAQSYSKLSRSSRQSGASLGILSGGDAASQAVHADDDDDAAPKDANDSGYYTAAGIAGLMSRVLSTTGAVGAHNDLEEEEEDATPSGAGGRSRPLRLPRNRCVASSNGWIVAALECAPSANVSKPAVAKNSAAISNESATGSKKGWLRLVSRWNVRRGSTLQKTSASSSSSANANSAATASSALAENLIAIPPPVGGDYANGGRIMHVFVDPTGCHAFLSARNGEAYHLHSTTRKVHKLAGFGPLAGDATSDSNLNAVGLATGSYVTAVAWDRERGTEGSTKKILIGTSIGEVYEYILFSPNHHIDGTDEPVDVAMDSEGRPIPALLHRLHSSEGSTGTLGGGGSVAAVTGIHFERLSSGTGGLSNAGNTATGTGSGLMVLAATSGLHQRTRLHTFRSSTASSFRQVFLQTTDDQNNSSHSSFFELPGSIDFADLRVCNDHFALRTETGIYYGTMDISGAGSSATAIASQKSAAVGPGGGIVDAGILPYQSDDMDDQRKHVLLTNIPISIALTPHHFITLSETNEVRFINRVAKKVIQKERVDWVMMSQASSSGKASPFEDNVMGVGGELLMDIRRPDQIWMRKSRALVHISSSCEDRDVWKFTLSKCLEIPGGAASSSTPRASPGRHNSLSGTSTVPSLSNEEKKEDSKFENAKSLCTNNTQRAVVTACRGEFHLTQGRVELAAKYLAQCPPQLAPFNDTCLRLALPMLGIDDPKSYGKSSLAKENLTTSNLALITYLSDKLRMGKMKDDNVVCTMTGAWLTELHLHERELASAPTRGRASGNSNNALLHQFLSANVNSMDAETIVRILSSHDVSAVECAGYAAASGDIGTAVNAALCGAADDKAGALDALRVLNDAPVEQAEPFYYKHASTLLARVPLAASKSFLSRYSQGLSATKLLPAFMHYERRRAEVRETILLAKKEKQSPPSSSGTIASPDNSIKKKQSPKKKLQNQVGTVHIEGSRSFIDNGVEVHIDHGNHDLPISGSFVDDETASIRYVEGVIKLGCKSNALYSYLISLYANMEDEAPLFRFLSAHVPASPSHRRGRITDTILASTRGRDEGPLDMSYALRVILRTGRHFRSAIKLYMGFGMRQQAVELALKVDPVFARELARDSVGVEERKRLWLMIARNAADDVENRGGKDVVAKVVSVLKECGPDVLSIEDVLPFLPDFAQIDQFKDEICDALTSYSSKIDQYLREMNECDQTCDALRDEIRRLGNHPMQMKVGARCAFTKKPVISESEPFYVFPSGFVVLESALKKEVIPHLNEKQRDRVEGVERELRTLKMEGGGLSSAEKKIRLEELRAELDGLIAAECPFTGTIMVDSIDQGFLDSMGQDDAFDSAAQWFDQPFMDWNRTNDASVMKASRGPVPQTGVLSSSAMPSYNF